MGRPREFDVDEAVDAALAVFWAKGFEGTTIADLTEAMHLKRGSIYAAYGSKAELFAKVLQRYVDTVFCYGAEAVKQPTARLVVAGWLHGAARATTGETTPHGCLLVQGALTTGDDGDTVRELLAACRSAGETLLTQRFERAVDEGDLSPGTDPAVAARYVNALAQGIAVEASTGASREQLENLAELALRRLPWE